MVRPREWDWWFEWLTGRVVEDAADVEDDVVVGEAVAVVVGLAGKEGSEGLRRLHSRSGQ